MAGYKTDFLSTLLKDQHTVHTSCSFCAISLFHTRHTDLKIADPATKPTPALATPQRPLKIMGSIPLENPNNKGPTYKNEHFGGNCLWDVSQLNSENSIQTQKNLEGSVWSFLSITGLRSQRQFALKCSFLASRPLGHCSFRISWQIP